MELRQLGSLKTTSKAEVIYLQVRQTAFICHFTNRDHWVYEMIICKNV